jgi:hypothetical protein
MCTFWLKLLYIDSNILFHFYSDTCWLKEPFINLSSIVHRRKHTQRKGMVTYCTPQKAELPVVCSFVHSPRSGHIEHKTYATHVNANVNINPKFIP